MKKTLVFGTLVAAMFTASPANAGEVTGNGRDLPEHGKSACAFSGLNDTPGGLWLPIGPEGALVQVDPGGHVQSYGAFKKIGFLPSPSDLEAREGGFPGASCNPNNGSGE